MSYPMKPIAPLPPTYKTTNHTFHLLMTVITFTGWLWLVWPWVALGNAMSNSSKRRKYDAEMREYQHAVALYEQQLQGRGSND